MKKASIYSLIFMTYSGMYINADVKLLQYIFEREPKKTTKKYHPDVTLSHTPHVLITSQ